MAISEAQLAANRANAQKSTGPRTPEGKEHSRVNAFRHGITGQIINLPPEQMKVYLDYNKEQMQVHAPGNAVEKQLAQTIIDTQWRMNAMRANEFTLFAEPQDNPRVTVRDGRPEMQDSFNAAQTLSTKLAELKLISLYEQRLNRTLQSTFKQLRELQAERREREKIEMPQAARIQKMMQMQGLPYNPADDGFVFSPRRFERYQSRELHLDQAEIAEQLHYDIEKFKIATAGMRL